MDCLIVGGGALGGYFGWRLARSGASVDVVCRSNHEAVAKDGFLIITEAGDERFVPRRTWPASDALPEGSRYDFVVLATKVIDEPGLLSRIDRIVRNARTICLLRNGVEVDKEVVAAFPNQEVLDIVPYVAATKTGPNVIRRSAPALFAIGVSSGSAAGHSAVELESALLAGGTRATVVPDVRAARWKKAVWNVAFNSVSSLLGGAGTRDMLADTEARQLVSQLMDEVCRVAAADGHSLPKDFVAFNLHSTAQMANYVPSTAQDVVAGKAFELDAIFANVLRVAGRHGVDTPVLATVTRLLQATSRIPSMARLHARTGT